ncbi:unnamed protein product [Closterium sp. Naga37s-1]|nr:unnamed protein product [Closterium sp. Naga37s-1]
MPALLEQADADLASLVNGLDEGDSRGVLVTDGSMVDVQHCEGVTKTGNFCGPVTEGEERAADGACIERMDDAGEPDELDTFDLTQMEGLDLPIVMSEVNLDEISGISSADFLPDLPEDMFADLPLDAPFDVVTLCEDSSDCAAREGLSDAHPSDARCEATADGSASNVEPASAVSFPASSPPPPTTPGNPPVIPSSSPSTSPSPLLKLPPFRPPQPLLRAAPPSGSGRGEAVKEGGAVKGERGEAATEAPAAAPAAGLVGGKRGAAGVNQQMAAVVALNRLLQQRQMLSNPANNPKQQLLLRALTAAATTGSGVPPAALVSVIAASAAASGAASAVASAGALSAGSEAGSGAGLAAGEASCANAAQVFAQVAQVVLQAPQVPQVPNLPQGSPGKSGMEINTALLASLLATATSSPSFAAAAAAPAGSGHVAAGVASGPSISRVKDEGDAVMEEAGAWGRIPISSAVDSGSGMRQRQLSTSHSAVTTTRVCLAACDISPTAVSLTTHTLLASLSSPACPSPFFPPRATTQTCLAACDISPTAVSLTQCLATTQVCLAACDISPTAVSLTTHTLSHALGQHTATRRFRGFVCDVAQGDLQAALTSRFTAPGIHSVLAPGGLLLFRDYGVFDMVMFRLQQQPYFFSVEEVRVLTGAAGFECEEVEYCCVRNENRRKGREMKRVWVHGVFKKGSG